MTQSLNGKRVAIVVHNGFEESEMTSPRQALLDAGATVDIVSPVEGQVKSWQHDKWGQSFDVDVMIGEAKADDYDALMLPGGVMNPDHLRRDEQVLSFVRSFFESHKPVAAICHGPWTLIDAGVVDGRKMTSYHSIQTDLKNAGAEWVDQSVVVDNGLVTSRNPDDLDDFNAKMVEEIAEGKHAAQTA